MSLSQKIKQHLINLPGWHTKRKIVLFESDDWGAVRTSSKQALSALQKAGVKIQTCHYMMNDSLASKEDLSHLFDTLMKHKGAYGNPVITANCLMTNPDFAKIASSSFGEYHWEPFTDSLKRHPDHHGAFTLWQQGQTAGLFHPQSHGREHLNISRWMADLQASDQITLLAFKYGVFGISGHTIARKRGSYLAAFDGFGEELKFNRSAIVQEGLELFKKTFGYVSESFIAPNYVWDEEIESAIAEKGVKYLQGLTVQRVSGKAKAPRKIIRHYQGQKNKKGQRYLIRNAHFEPASDTGKDWVDSCLKEIETAFLWHKPAIIETHRVNFVGFLNPRNRDRNIKLFDQLLQRMLKRWPDLVFMTSDQLGRIINGKLEEL